MFFNINHKILAYMNNNLFFCADEIFKESHEKTLNALDC